MCTNCLGGMWSMGTNRKEIFMELVESRIVNLVSVDGYYDHERAWFTREQIGAALGYADPQISIANIHNRHKERFEGRSVQLKLSSTDGKTYETWAYNFKGVMEICRWSNQPKANEVMDELYDMAEAVAEKGYYSYMSDEQLLELLKARVAKDEKFLRDAPVDLKSKKALATVTMDAEIGKLWRERGAMDRRTYLSKLEDIYNSCANYDGCFKRYLKEVKAANEFYTALEAKMFQ